PTTMAFQVRGTTAPMLAIIGAGTEAHQATVMPMPQDLMIVGPGQGEISIPEVAGLPGESVRIDLSNMAGTWLDTYAVVSLNGVAELVERAGGLEVTLGEAYPTKAGPLGPGAVTLTGKQVKAFLAGSTDDAATRWEFVLTALLEDPPALEEADIAETDDAQAASEVFAGAQGADVTQVPTVVVAGTVRIPKYDELDRIMADSFGATTPTPAIVQNGNGEAGVGEAVGAKLIPAGFRITLSQNAQTFDLITTDVFANGLEFEEDAKRARKALGVGRVRVSQVPSGIGDVLIVVGKDFTVDEGGTG
ncbi:MAG TPA: LCP family protein, partial [Actinomycetota bacterium]